MKPHDHGCLKFVLVICLFSFFAIAKITFLIEHAQVYLITHLLLLELYFNLYHNSVFFLRNQDLKTGGL
jgi:hypothetical protein